ncbi:putative glycine-betaine binding permease protein [Marinithermofilum abyssi]|jgi:ABC-type proline/glycine betaine transport system permease subunit/ABC-type proline/glycine betaine transport system substrate-binding protein|uniref:Putative glycine-betaine binding permease protein n=1 Tax=Marinithermofilum abyssi TaxID=1571185 RepID=A0A8J2VDY5_9BACL|nr:ABC transporter permease/substrate binding protein [Marinithermofilum abyssi]GGE20248.1 putative glycine-betaine binding permease protein [Marinithermofilum abyssi]
MMILPKLPLDKWVDWLVKWLQDNLSPLFDGISSTIEPLVDFFHSVLTVAPPLITTLLIAFLAFLLTSRWSIALFTLFGFLLIDNLGYWNEATETISLVLTATTVAIVIGVPLGILSARSRKVQNVITPILDFMQTMPAFVYLIPAVFFFALGSVPGIIASVIFAMPPTIRLTSLGIRQVAEDLIEAADAFGSTPSQKLFKVQLPLAKPTILAGINQTIMLSLSMVVIASMIGAGGLGTVVLQAITRLEVGKGFEGGLCIVIIAIVLDRITQSIGRGNPGAKKSRFLFSWKGWTALLLVLALVGAALAQQQVGAKKTITLTYVNWESEVASTHVLKKVLEDEGFNVELKEVDAGPMFAGVASGDADGTTAAWLPVTHKDYMEKNKDKVVDLGPNLKGTKVGLVVPKYVKADSIDDLKRDASQFNNKIIGIEAGAGVMQLTEKAIKDYDLGMELVTSSSAAMTASLEKAYKSKKPIVVTGWKPHWKFAKYDLKFLKDPKNVYGGTENIHTLVRKGLKEDNPKAYKIMDRFFWTSADMEEVMLDIQNGKSPEKAAADWIEKHQDKVKEWTK